MALPEGSSGGEMESAFAAIRHRASRAKGGVTRGGRLRMIFKLGERAEQNRRLPTRLCPTSVGIGFFLDLSEY